MGAGVQVHMAEQGQPARCEGRFIPGWAQHRVARALGRTVWSDNDQTNVLPSGDNTAAQCRPWHRGDFLARLSTFKTLKWFAKPAPLSAIECARHGWSNSAVDTLECQVCAQTIVIATPLEELIPAGPGNNSDTLTQLASSLPLAHSSHCGWRINPCHSSVADPIVTSPATVIKDFTKRYNTITCAEVQVSLAHDAQVTAISNKVKQSQVLERFPDVSAFVLALFGWSADEKKDRLCCHECTRVVGLWNFRHASNTSVGTKRPMPGDNNQNEPAAFDPVKEHYSYCSWIQKVDAAESSTQAEEDLKDFIYSGGWQVCASVLFQSDSPLQSVVSPVRNTTSAAPIEPSQLASNVAKFFATSVISNHK